MDCENRMLIGRVPRKDLNYDLVLIKTKKCKFISRIQVEFGVFLDWVVGKMMSRS